MTVDQELADALDSVPRAPGTSRSRLVRDLALAGARHRAEERDRHREAVEFLLSLPDDDRYDFEVARQLHESR